MYAPARSTSIQYVPEPVEIFGGNLPRLSAAYANIATPNWLILLMHFTALACDRAADIVGNKIAMIVTMIPMTTSISTRVNPRALPEPYAAVFCWTWGIPNL